MRWRKGLGQLMNSSRTAKPMLSELLVRDNAFGFMRLALALAVILSHAFPISGSTFEPLFVLSNEQLNLGLLAVGGFFVISGFLITSSATVNDTLQFVWKRFLRIFPAYWFILILTAFVIAPLLYWRQTGGVDGFWLQQSSPTQYITGNWTLQVRYSGIGDLLINTPYGQEVHASVFNGSLWSLLYEFRCYVAVAILGVVGIIRRARFVVPIITAGLGVLVLISVLHLRAGYGVLKAVEDVMGTRGDNSIRLSFLFALGACFALYADRIPLSKWGGAVSALVFILTLRFGGFFPIGCVAFAYLLLWSAAVLPQLFKRVGREHDISYGIYLYGFLVEQLLAEFGFLRLGLGPFVLLAMVLASGCGALSWLVIERPALSWKSRGPGRGLAYFRNKWSHRGQKPESQLAEVTETSPEASKVRG